MPPEYDQIDLVIFDCDGVLVDSEGISAAVLTEELARFGVTITPEFVRDYCLGRSFPTVARSIRGMFDLQLPEDFEARYRAVLLQRYECELKTTEGIETVLTRLDRAACVATSSSPPRVKKTLQLTGLDRFFGDRVFTASMVARGKPAPDLFLHAAREMGVEPGRTLVIEDSQPGVRAGQAAGMEVVLFAGGTHLHGVDRAGFGTIKIFDSWADFPQELLRRRDSD